jgi:hypothetical protein
MCAPAPRYLGFSLAFALLACGGSEPTPPSVSPPNPPSPPVVAGVTVTPAPDLMLVGQTALLRATASSANGEVIPASITWTSSDNSVASVTDAGLVTAAVTGIAQITARTGAYGTSTTVYVAQGTPFRLRLSGQPSQQLEAGTVVATPPVALVVDAQDRPVPGVEVTFSSSSATAVVDGATQRTNAAGAVQLARWTLPTKAGTDTLRANTPAGLQAAAVTQVRAGALASVSLLSGNDQTEPAGHVLYEPIRVRAVDKYDNPVSGLTVSIQVAASAGTFAPAAPITDSTGIATTLWTLPRATGDFAATMTIGSQPSVPLSAHSRGNLAKSLTLGIWHACFIDLHDRAWCHGDNYSFKLGRTGDGSHIPTLVGTTVRFRKLAATENSSCGLATDGKVYCWGDGGSGQLGDGTQAVRSIPRAVTSTETFTDIAGGQFAYCAVAATGSVWCWGRNTNNALALSGAAASLAVVPTPARVDTDITFKSVTGHASYRNHCGIAADNRAICWGDSTLAGAGGVLPPTHSGPVQVEGGGIYESVSVANMMCALTLAHELRCWGRVPFEPGYLLGPQPVLSYLKVAAIASGTNACLITESAELRCWINGNTVPIPVQPVGFSAREVRNTLYHSCAIDLERQLFCWGRAFYFYADSPWMVSSW